MELNVVVVAAEESLQENYSKALEEHPVRCTAVPSLSGLFSTMTVHPLHGILVDMPVSIRATDEEKELLQELAHRIPILRVRWDEGMNGIRAILYQDSHPVGIEEFLTRYCRPECTSLLRRDSRFPLHLPVLLAETPAGLSNHPERASTLNISERGCFVLTPRGGDFGEILWISIPALGDPAPITLEVRWKIAWGQMGQLPGLGCRFEKITPDQLAAIRSLTGGIAAE